MKQFILAPAYVTDQETIELYSSLNNILHKEGTNLSTDYSTSCEHSTTDMVCIYIVPSGSGLPIVPLSGAILSTHMDFPPLLE